MSAFLVCLAAVAPTLDRTIHQFSTFEELKVGHYDGTVPIRAAMRMGDFGLGAFDGLDGEMIVLDGHVYRADGFGDLSMGNLDGLTPYMFVTKFRADQILRFEGETTRAELQAAIERAVPNPDQMLAIRMRGRFDKFLGRSYGRQMKPYLPFAQLADKQSLFPYPEISATLVGFRLPKSVDPVNVPGYHFHFVNDDRTRGGHVLTYRVQSAVVEIMRIERLHTERRR